MKPIWRCSSLDRNLLCNGAPTLEPLVAPRQGTEGQEGDFLHWLSHSKLKVECGAVGDIGPSPVVPKSISFSAWIADYYVRTIREIVPPSWSLECEVPLSYEFDRFILSGHIDDCAMSPDATEAMIFDLKTGRDAVDPADNNEQLFGYVCLLLRAYPTLRKVSAYLVQPLNDEDEGYQRVSGPAVIEGDVLDRCIPTLEARVNAALDNSMEVDDSPKACNWCSVGIQCPAVIARRNLMKMKLTEEHIASIKHTPDDAVLGSWVVAGRIISRPLSDATDLAKERIERQGSITSAEGVVITAKTGPGSYKYPQPAAFLAALRRRLPTDEDIAPALSFSISRARDAIAEKLGLPKTAKVGESGDSIVAAELKPLAEQGTRTVLQFSQ